MLGLLAAGLTATTVVGIHQLSSISTQDEQFATGRLEREDRVRVMQLTFKTQVQSWKAKVAAAAGGAA